eukprot:462442-Hanusia_phi.AAC.1
MELTEMRSGSEEGERQGHQESEGIVEGCEDWRKGNGRDAEDHKGGEEEGGEGGEPGRGATNVRLAHLSEEDEYV